jgi:hypothetical protein
MIDEPRDKGTGETPSEAISQYPGELDLDAVGIWQIVPDGRVTFGLSGDALADYVRRAIYALLDAGAVPVRHVPGSGFHWTRQTQYGSTREEIAEAIIAEWKPVPYDSYSMIEHCPWFARPRPTSPNYVKMD